MTIPIEKPASMTRMHLNPLLLAIACLLALLTSVARAEEPPLRDLLRDGLYAEEVTRDPEAAAKHYEQVLARHSEQRAFAASALFRLAEVRRKQDRKDEAIQLYQRLLTEFPNAETEVKLAREHLAGLGGRMPVAEAAVPDAEAAELARLEGLAETSPDILLHPNTLQSAVSADWSKVVKYLMGKGTNPYQGHALSLAAERGNMEIVKQLIGSNALMPEKVASNAILAAIRNDRHTLLEFLLKQGLKPGLADSGYGPIPIFVEAVLNDHLRGAEILLEHGANVNMIVDAASGPDFRPCGTALHLVLSTPDGKFDAASWLLQKGAKAGLPDPYYGLTPLHYAAMNESPGAPGMIGKLLEAGADPNRRSNDRLVNDDWKRIFLMNATPLEIAIAFSGSRSAKIKLLLEHGAKPDQEGSRVAGCLEWLIRRDDPSASDLIEILGAAGFSMNDPELLSRALQAKDPNILGLLLKHGADPDFLTFDPKLPFRESLPLISIASFKGDAELVKVLLDAGADLKIAGPDLIQNTARFSKGDPVECLKLLAAAGAVPDEEWRKSGYPEARRDALRYLIERFRIPEMIGGPDINLLVDRFGSISTLRIAAPTTDPKPPELVSWLLTNGHQIQLPIVEGNRTYQWSIVRRDERGEPARLKVDFFSDATVPELRWGDLIVFEPVSEAGVSVEFRNGLPNDLLWSLRQRLTFPIQVEIEGELREVTVKGSRLVFDPTKNEVPLLPVKQIVGLLWQPPFGLGAGFAAEISISREGWPDIRLAYDSMEAGNFQLKAGDRVRLELTEEMRQNLAHHSRNFVSVRMHDYPFLRTLGVISGGKLIEPTIPSLIQALVEIQVPTASVWAHLAGSSTLSPDVLAEGEVYFERHTLFPHPDLSRIRIHRTDGDGGEKQIDVDLAKIILAATDALTPEEARKSDVMLQAGDVVEIPVIKDRLDTPWKGYSTQVNAFFAKALAGRLQVTDENGKITIRDIDYRAPRFLEAGGSWIPVPPESGVPSAQAGWQARSRIDEVRRGGTAFGRAFAQASFLRDGDAIRLGRAPIGPSVPILPPSR